MGKLARQLHRRVRRVIESHDTPDEDEVKDLETCHVASIRKRRAFGPHAGTPIERRRVHRTSWHETTTPAEQVRSWVLVEAPDSYHRSAFRYAKRPTSVPSARPPLPLNHPQDQRMVPNRNTSSPIGTRLVATLTLLTSLAPGQVAFQPTHVRGTGMTSSGHRVVDMNGDGILDVVAITDTGEIHSFLGRGDGTFDPAVRIAHAFGAIADLPLFVVEVTGDGRPDVVVVHTAVGNPRLQTLINTGQGTLQPHAIMTLPDAPGHATFADLDGDGDEDLAYLGGTSAQRVSIFQNVGNGFGPVLVQIPFPFGAPQLSAVDMDGDRDIDLVGLSFADGRVHVLENQGNLTFIDRASIAVPNGTFRTEVHDVIGNAAFDLVHFADEDPSIPLGPQVITVQEGLGNGNYGPVTILDRFPHITGAPLVVADLDANGRRDLLINGGTRIALSSGSSFTVQDGLPFVRGAAAIGDVDRDGDVDVVRAGFEEGGRPPAVLMVHQNTLVGSVLHWTLDETSGRAVANTAIDPATSGPAWCSRENWQGDPGLGRETFRGNDPGYGCLRHGSFGVVAGALTSPITSSFTVMWWQQLTAATTGDSVYLTLGGTPEIRVVTSIFQPGILTILHGGSTLGTLDLRTTVGRWLHVAIVYDESLGTLRFLFDGRLDTAGPFRPASLAIDRITLGGDYPGLRPNATLHTDFDDLRLYRGALSVEAIRAARRDEGAHVARWETGCPGAFGPVTLHAEGPVALGYPIILSMNSAFHRPGQAIVLGTSTTSFLGAALPLDLGAACFLHVAPIVAIPAHGNAGAALVLPDDPNLAGVHVYAQGVFYDNRVAVTNTLDLRTPLD